MGFEHTTQQGKKCQPVGGKTVKLSNENYGAGRPDEQLSTQKAGEYTGNRKNKLMRTDRGRTKRAIRKKKATMFRAKRSRGTIWVQSRTTKVGERAPHRKPKGKNDPGRLREVEKKKNDVVLEENNSESK